MIKKLTLTILLAVTASLCFAQQNKIPFEKYGVAEGLPEEYVMGMLQDDKGFIWFGTQNGLVKYDGYKFKVYRVGSDKSDNNSLQIRNLGGSVLKAKDGKIWIGGDEEKGGISCFDPTTEKFKLFQPTNKFENSDNWYSYILFEDKESNIWFKSTTFLNNKAFTYRLNPVTGVIKQFPLIDVTRRNRYLQNFGTVQSSNTIWLLDEKKNLNKWNRQKDSFEIVIPAGKKLGSSAKADTLRQLTKGADDRMLLMGLHSLYIFDSKQEKVVQSFVHDANNTKGLPDSIILGYELRGQFWLMHSKGFISIIEPATGTTQTFRAGNYQHTQMGAKDSVRICRLLTQNKDGIWFEALGREFRPRFFLYYDFTTKAFTFYDYNFNGNNPLPKLPNPYHFLEDRSGLLWLGTRPGLYKQAPKKQQMDLFRYKPGDPNGLPSDSIRYLFEDSKKRLWIGTQNGLAIYQTGQQTFSVFRSNATDVTSLSDNWINAIVEDSEGNIWITTRNGINQWQESTGRFKRFFYNRQEKNDIVKILIDQQQRIWISIWDKGVFVLDHLSGKVIKSFMPDTSKPASISSKKIDVMYQDSRSNMWLGDREDNKFGLYKLNEAETGFVHYVPVAGNNNSISSNEIFFLAEDGKKRLWIGTDEGLNSYDYAKDNFTRYRTSEASSISSYTLDKNGEPWFGTYSGGGFVSLDVKSKVFTAYGESKGLLHNDMSHGSNSKIAKDEQGRFWLPNQRGLSVFDPEKKTFISYFEKDGFQPYNRNYVALKTANGDIWIGSNHGLNRVVPADLLKKDTTTPSIVITQISINDSLYSSPDGVVFKKSVAYTNDIELKYWQKNLSFDFVALHYLRSEDNLYSWKLENYDKDWSAPSKERKASYTNLSPGKYIFRVKASNADGAWNEEGISITITILPPWWKTWWAYTLYALLFLAALRIFSKWRERRLRQEKENLQAKVEERTIELKKSIEDLKSTQSQLIQSEKMASLGELTAGIAHEIQNPLNFVNNFSEVNKELLTEMNEEIVKGNFDEVKALAKDVTDNEEKIIFHGKRADAIVKGMLQHSRSSNGVKEPTDINALCDEYLRLAYHGLRAKDKSFNATMKTDFDESIGNINIIPQDIGRVILNLITNAFYVVDEKKKSGIENYEPTVSVSTKKINGKVEIKVADNGNGIPQKALDKIFQPFFTTKPTGQGTGLGLSLSYDIVKAHGGDLTVETKEGEGSEFIIMLPQ